MLQKNLSFAIFKNILLTFQKGLRIFLFWQIRIKINIIFIVCLLPQVCILKITIERILWLSGYPKLAMSQQTKMNLRIYIFFTLIWLSFLQRVINNLFEYIILFALHLSSWDSLEIAAVSFDLSLSSKFFVPAEFFMRFFL